MQAHSALVFALLVGLGSGCQGTPDAPDVAPEPAPQPTTTEAKPEWTWAGVELVGLAHIDRAEVLAEIDLEVGTPFSLDREAWKALEARLVERFGCIKAKVTAVRYVGFKAYLVVDLIEKGDEASLVYAAEPTGDIPLATEEIIELFEQVRARQHEGFNSGKPYAAMTDGGFMDFEDQELHALAERLHALVPEYRLNLIEVLHGDRDGSKRAMAATLLNWGGSTADSIARASAGSNDPSSVVRNNVTRFMLHYLKGVESAEVRKALIASLSLQLRRPSHSDRNKAVYGLLFIMQARPADGPAIEAAAGDELRVIARDSVLFNVGDPARELLALLGTA